MMFPKEPKKQKEKKKLKQNKGLVAKTPLKQNVQLKQNKGLVTKTPLKQNVQLKQNKGLVAKTPLKQNVQLKQNKGLVAKTPLKQNVQLKQNKGLVAKTSLKQNVQFKEKIFKFTEQKGKFKLKNITKVKKIRTNARAIFSDFTQEEKKYIYDRDNNRCIYCSGMTYLGVAHVFASRQKGGIGSRKNGVVLCQICHNSLDNGKDTEKRNQIQSFCEGYLKNIYGEIKKEDIIYDKYNNNKKII